MLRTAAIIVALLTTHAAWAGPSTDCGGASVTWAYDQAVDSTMLCTEAVRRCSKVTDGAKCEIPLTDGDWAKWTKRLDRNTADRLTEALLYIGDDFVFKNADGEVQGVIRRVRQMASAGERRP